MRTDSESSKKVAKKDLKTKIPLYLWAVLRASLPLVPCRKPWGDLERIFEGVFRVVSFHSAEEGG